MASVNRAAKTPTPRTHEGAPAARIDAIDQLERSVMSCLLWEDEFYEDGKSIANRITELVAVVPAKEVARIAIQAKQDMRLRHVPLLLAREMLRTKEGRALFGMVARKVFLRADDICEFLAMYWKDDKDAPLAKQVKKHVGETFRRFDEYQLAKYNGGQKAIKLRDAIRILRPKPDSAAQSKLWKRLVKGELKTPDTWEVELSASKDKKASWNRLLKEAKLGGLAMLRNIRNMTQAGVADNAIKKGIRAIEAGRLLPINFITAANHNTQYEPEIEAKFLECFAAKPKHSGSTVILVDVSSSMDDKLAGRSELRRVDVACSLAMIGREMFGDCRVFTFSDNLVEIPARRGFALRDAIMKSQHHNGTQLGASVCDVVKNCEFERMIVITDEQSADRVPQVKGAYMINVASYQNGVGYGEWLHIDGWSDKVLDYITAHERGFSRLYFEEEVKRKPVKMRKNSIRALKIKRPLKGGLKLRNPLKIERKLTTRKPSKVSAKKKNPTKKGTSRR